MQAAADADSQMIHVNKQMPMMSIMGEGSGRLQS